MKTYRSFTPLHEDKNARKQQTKQTKDQAPFTLRRRKWHQHSFSLVEVNFCSHVHSESMQCRRRQSSEV